MVMKLVFFTLIFTVVLLEAKRNLWGDLPFPRKAIINYLFPKNPGIQRVRHLDEIRTEVNNVTTLNFIGLVEKYGYTAEEHYVTTEDGYNLVIHRISRSPLFNNQHRRKIIFVQHGILCTSDCWVLAGPGKDLVFLLTDQGYDVWIGNFRGNSYCRSHVKLSPQSKNFWQFSFHEHGIKDLPVMIDYVLSYTKEKDLYYIGHSMGTTSLFTLLSVKPEYNAKIKFGILLAPIAFMKELRSPPIESIYNKAPQIKKFLNSNEIYEFGSLSSTTITFGRTLCTDKAITQAVCAAGLFLFAGSNPAQLNTTMLPELFSHFPAGTSIQTLNHYLQNFMAQKFQAFDYGYLGNYEQYGQTTPIIYNLKNVITPLALFHGANDLLAIKPTVLEVYRQLPNVILLEENPSKNFTHLDFLWAIDAKSLLYDRIIEILQGFDTWQVWTFDELA